MIEKLGTTQETASYTPVIIFSEGTFHFPKPLSQEELHRLLIHEGIFFQCGTAIVRLEIEEVGSYLYLNIVDPKDKELIGYQKVTLDRDQAQNMYKRYTDGTMKARYGSQSLFRSSLSIFFEVLKQKGIKTVTGRVKADDVSSIKSRQNAPKLFQANSIYQSELKEAYSKDEKDLVTYLD